MNALNYWQKASASPDSAMVCVLSESDASALQWILAQWNLSDIAPKGAWIPRSTNPDRDGCLWPIAIRDPHGGFVMAFEYYHFQDGWATGDDIAAWWNQPVAPVARPQGPTSSGIQDASDTEGRAGSALPKDGQASARNDTALRSKACPECASESYYWLKSSGRCASCGFHWGLTETPAKHPDCEDRCQLKEHKGYRNCSETGQCQFKEST